jgi:hypothetical protein
VDIAAAVSWFAAARWSRMEAGSLRRKRAKNNESGGEVSYLRASISAIIAEGRRSPSSGWSRSA